MSNAHTLNLVVEGWRGINHSFAMVNQFQLLELAKISGLHLYHSDKPYFFSHWNKTDNAAGFHEQDEKILSSISNPPDLHSPDWIFRIYSPFCLLPPPKNTRLAVFLVTELGLDQDSFVEGSDIEGFLQSGGSIITPSHWSKERIVDFGFDAASIKVIPHAASPDYFFPHLAGVAQAQRRALGFRDDETILLNIGAAIWNKGIDILLVGFALARQRRKDLRLVFKDQRNTYGIAGESYVQSTLAAAGLLSDDVLQAITMIPSNLTLNQMNSMYGLADCYVSPYRAEGYNLPVREAMASGTPVIVTEGGATDDFVEADTVNRKIASTRFEHAVIQGRDISAYCEPNLEHLVELLVNVQQKTAQGNNEALAEPNAGWLKPVSELVSYFRQRL